MRGRLQHKSRFRGRIVDSSSSSASPSSSSRPDVGGLFQHYNELYFGSKLRGCNVVWSSQRTRLAGKCIYNEGGCQIRLSEPILKSRSQAELKATLLHQMIHAYLCFTENICTQCEHGSLFQAKLDEVISSDLQDKEKPEEGYVLDVARCCSVSQNTCGAIIEAGGTSDDLRSRLRSRCRRKSPEERQKTNGPSSDPQKAQETLVTGTGTGIGIHEQDSANKEASVNKEANKRKLQTQAESKSLKTPRLDYFFGKERKDKRRPLLSTSRKPAEVPNVIIGWKGWFALEPEEEECEKLIDRRWEKRLEESARISVLALANECAKFEGEETLVTENKAYLDTREAPGLELQIREELQETETAGLQLQLRDEILQVSPLDTREGAGLELQARDEELRWDEEDINGRLKLEKCETGHSDLEMIDSTAIDNSRALVLRQEPVFQLDFQSLPDAKLVYGKRNRKKKQQKKAAELQIVVKPVTTTMTVCPICKDEFDLDTNKAEDNARFNTHVDECLNTICHS